MMDSFLTTRSESTQIRVYYQVDSITNIFNKAFKDNPDYDFYMPLNDDIIFKTPDWDLKLANKGKISYGTDSVKEGVNGQFLMIDGDIVRALGWLQMPLLHKYAGDVVWRLIGGQLGILEYHPEVVIEHQWGGADSEVNTKDMAAFASWLPHCHKDINKIREFYERKTRQGITQSIKV